MTSRNFEVDALDKAKAFAASLVHMSAGLSLKIGNMIDKAKVPELLYDLCVVLGYCLPHPVQTQIENDPPQTVDEFTDAVFVGEGMDKNKYPKKWLQVRERVQNYFDLHKS